MKDEETVRERIQVIPVKSDQRVWKDKDKEVLMTSMTQEERDAAFSKLSKSAIRTKRQYDRMVNVLKQLEQVSQERGSRISINNELIDEALNEGS